MQRYSHNCPKCQFLGTFVNYDLYACRSGFSRQVRAIVLRFGDEPFAMSEIPYTGQPPRAIHAAYHEAHRLIVSVLYRESMSRLNDNNDDMEFI